MTETQSDSPRGSQPVLAIVNSDEAALRIIVRQQRAEIERLKDAIRRLAEQDGTLSVCDGAVTVQVDGSLTTEEQKALLFFAGYGRPQNGPVIGKHAETLRRLSERLAKAEGRE